MELVAYEQPGTVETFRRNRENHERERPGFVVIPTFDSFLARGHREFHIALRTFGPTTPLSNFKQR